MNRLFVLAPVLATALACGAPDAADLVLVNGHIYTLDEQQPWAEAVAVRGEQIVAVGSNSDTNVISVSPEKSVILAPDRRATGTLSVHFARFLYPDFLSPNPSRMSGFPTPRREPDGQKEEIPLGLLVYPELDNH